jgi:hypothetical protein
MKTAACLRFFLFLMQTVFAATQRTFAPKGIVDLVIIPLSIAFLI